MTVYYDFRAERGISLGQQIDLRDEVIEAAKGWVRSLYSRGLGHPTDPDSSRLWGAVKNLEAAERPGCNLVMNISGQLCDKPAIQTIKAAGAIERHRCEQHKEEVITYDDDATR